MSALQERKRKEAEEALKQGNKYLEKTMFRWQPDYLSAGPLFEKAADAFRAAGDMEMAKKMFAQAAVVQNKNKSPFRAAQACENAAKVVVQQIKDTRATGAVKDKYLGEIKQSYESACNYYSDMGELGKAADALLKGAVVLEENGLADVKDLYMRACSLMEAQGKPHFAVETFRKTFTYVLKAGLYQDAVALLHRQVALFLEIDQRANIHKCYLSEIILLLVLGDVAAADRTYMDQLQSDEYLKSDECALAEDLVRAFKQGNEELLQQTIRKQGFSFLDNQVGRLVRKLSIYGNNAAPPTSSSSAPSSRTVSRTASSNQSRTGSASKPNPFAPTTATKDRYAHAGSSSTSRPAAPPPAPEHRAPPPPPATVEPVAAPATMESEFDFPTESMASLTVASEDDVVPSTTDFDFDSLQFSSEPHVHADDDVAGDNSTNTPATTGSSVQQPPHDEEEFDLT